MRTHCNAWNKGRLLGQKPPLKPNEIWSIRIRLQLTNRTRDLALFNLAFDSKLCGCLRENENARTAYLAQTRRVLYDRESQADQKRQAATQEHAKAVHREELTTLTAPVDGVIQQVAIHTSGGVVTEAQAMMIVVPEGAQITAEVTLDNKDIGFVMPGQDAAIKLATFNFTRYGTIDGKVTMVTADAVNDEKRGAIFPVTLAWAWTRSTWTAS